MRHLGYLRLGALDQWVMLRGESLANPPLILLYGGPGMTEMRFFRVSQGETENSKLVEVHYEPVAR
jgi:hypothetical protein